MNKYLGMKQKMGSSNCLAIVAGMAFNCHPDEFEMYWGWEPPYHLTQFMVFGLTKGFLPGISIRFNEGIELDDDVNALVVKVPFMDRGIPFHAAVESETVKGLEHAIYFDGNQIYDPSPLSENGRSLSSYRVVDIQFIEGPGDWFSDDIKNKVTSKIMKPNG